MTPPLERPIPFRVGTYRTFREQMLAELPRLQVGSDGPPPARPLEVLDPGTSRDFAAALIDAWATVGDVLTFYQERLLNEGFLRTVMEPRSIRALIAQLGLSPEPGVAASTQLAFTVAGAPGSPERIRVPAGTGAQSIPGTGETAQTFETSADIEARPAWNAMVPAPVLTTVTQALTVAHTQARLAGTGTGLTVGAPVLAAAADGSAFSFGTVVTVETSTPARETRVAWDPAPGGTRAGPLTDPTVLAFGRATRLFGYNAAPWSALTTQQKRAHREILGGVFVWPGDDGDWMGASGGLPAAVAGTSGGLPAADVRALAVDEAGRIYAGTAGQGLYVSADGGLTWSAGGSRWADVFSLAAGAQGRMYAGAAGGRVLRSCDGGATWASVSGSTTIGAGKSPEVVDTRLPASPVRAVFDDGAGTLYAGTDFGPWSSDPDVFPAWSPVTLSLDSPGEQPAVWSFAAIPWGGVAVGAAGGVWAAAGGLPLGTDLPSTLPDGEPNVVRALLASGSALLAGTDAGLYSLAAAGGAWTAVPGPASGGVPLAVSALVLVPPGVVAATAGVIAATPGGVFLETAPGVWAAIGTQGMPPEPPSSDCHLGRPVPAPPGLNQVGVTALAAGAEVLVAAAPYAGFWPEAWPGPPICENVIALSGTISGVVPGSWIVLQQGPDPAGHGPPPEVAVLRVSTVQTHEAAVQTRTLERYGRRGQATEVRVDPAPGLERFDLRATRAYVASRPLSPAAQTLAVDGDGDGPSRADGKRTDVVGGAGGDFRRAPLPRSRVSGRSQELRPFAGSRLRVAGPVPALPAGRAVSVTGLRIRAAAWPRAGVFVAPPPPTTAGFATAGLASVEVVAVAWAPGGRVLAAIGGDPGAAGPATGLWWTDDAGATWSPAAGKLDGVQVNALAAGPAALWAAGPAGAVFTSADGATWESAGTAGRAVTALAVDAAGTVYAATADAGVLRRDAGGAWSTAAGGLPAGPVRALAAAPDGGMVAATAQGAWWLAAGAPAWTAWSAGLASLDVIALAVLPDGRALAGTGGGGVFSAAAALDEWKAASAGLDASGARFVAALAAGSDGTAWAGTRGAGCYALAPGAAAWTRAPLGVANDVRALAVGERGVVAGCGAVPLLASEGGVHAALALQPLLALPAKAAAALDVGSLPADALKRLKEAGIKLPATPTVRTHAAGKAWWIDASQGVLLLRLDAGAVRVRRPRGLATLMGPPPSTSLGVAAVDGGNHPGTLTPRKGELFWQPASAASLPVGEVARVAASATSGLRSTTLTLQRPLENAYDPSTVQLCANLAPATQGATQGHWPHPEVLGSGNASAAGQSFRLARSPLTFVSTPSGRAAALQVWVNGVRWREVETLYGQPENAAVYEVRVDEKGAGTVTFGDGIYGARLPMGVGNVAAQYRVGIGISGNLGAGRVTILRSAPLGVKQATNPVPAAGGAPGQTAAQAAASAPRAARVLARVVSLDDFTDYALDFPGIDKAVAETVRDRRGRAVVALTVAGGRGGPVVPDAALLDELRREMVGAGAHGAFRVMPCAPLAFVVRARLEVDPARHAGTVLADARAALAALYDPERRALGQGAASSAAVAALQGVTGVVGVELSAFHLVGDTPGVETLLQARGARVDPRAGILPAQLLLPAPAGGITLSVAEAP